VYAVNEDDKQSTLSTFAYNSKEHTLKFLNKNNTLGADPCYVIDDAQNVIAANYGGGSIAIFKKMTDNSIKK
jgi:6-phosphogluconolactonase